MQLDERLNIELTLKNCDNIEFPVQLDCVYENSVYENSILRISFTDISQIKQAELALRESEALALISAERLRTEKVREEALNRLVNISSQLPGMMFQFHLNNDGSSYFPYVSAAIHQIYRLSPEDVLKDASKVYTLIHPDDYDGVIASMQESIHDLSQWFCEYRVKFDDGTVIWVQGSALIEREMDGSTMWYGVITDVTEHRHGIDLIYNIAQYSRSLIEASLDPLVTINVEGKITDVNIATEQMTGVARNHLIGSDFADYFTHPENARSVYKQVFLHDFVTDYPLAIRHVSGKITDVLYNASLYHDNKGKVLGVFAAARDITELKIAENKAKVHLDKLAQVTRIGLMGEMASGIAHEVNQPLAAIAAYTQVSINLIQTKKPDLVKIKEILAKTQEQALRAGRIIHRMKEFGKSTSQQHLITDINTLIYDATDFCVTELKHSNVTICFELTPSLPPVFVDHIQIEQVLINLIRNSIDALQDLPLNIPRKLTLCSSLNANNAIQISVKDNGLGIDEVQRQKILTPFHTTKINGTGMGLSISRSLIENYSGVLYFNSELGKGSTFYFTLPIETAERESFNSAMNH